MLGLQRAFDEILVTPLRFAMPVRKISQTQSTVKAKQVRLDELLMPKRSGSASPSVSVNNVPLSISTIGATSTLDNSTPIPTEPVIGLAVTECATQLSSSSTPSASNTFSSSSSDSRKSFAKSTLHKFNKKWLCDPEFYDQNLNLNIFYVHPLSGSVLCSICSVHPELGKQVYVTEPAFQTRMDML